MINNPPVVTEANLTLADNTTNDSTAARHGFLPKLSGSASDVLKGDGTWGAGSSFTALSASQLTVTNDGSNGKPFVATWSDVTVNSLGSVTTGNKRVATLPAKTIVKNVFVSVTVAESALATFTVSVGRTGAGYVDYIVASNGKAIAIYGNDSAERGTNNTLFDIASWTATTDIFIQFVSTGDDLDAALDTAGTVVIDYMVIP